MSISTRALKSKLRYGNNTKKPRTSTTHSARRQQQHREASEVIGDEVASLRAQVGMSQWDVACSAEVDLTYPSLLERGLRCPTLITFIRYVRALKADPTKTFTRILKDLDARKLVQD